MSNTRMKILEAAIQLFAKKGYRETSVGQIEAEAGLAPRAGGFYRHFKAKEDLLIEAVELYVREVDRELQFSDVLPLGDTRAELLLIGRTQLNAAKRHSDLRKIIRREGRHLKKVSALVHANVQEDAFKEILPWLKDKVKQSGQGIDDIEALAVNVFGPVFFVLYAEDQGDEPLRVSRERFLMNWATHWAAAIDSGTL